jgi:hypothetical protein
LNIGAVPGVRKNTMNPGRIQVRRRLREGGF